ncbi:hypothetical protein DSECCO2_469430 [anaerobic digester metagenome]
MKKITLFFLFVSAMTIAFAQQVRYYNFENTLNEVNGLSPALAVLGEQGSYVLDTLNEVNQNTKTVYRFTKNSGLQFHNVAAGNFLGDNYTIEIYFVFDELSSWKRVVDWKNRKTDWGAYVYYGELNFYNILYSQEAPVEAGEYTYYVITRTAASGQVLIYTDAEVEIDFIDNGGHALIDGDGVLNFFHDDLVVPNEASAGAVAMIKLYDYPLTDTEITQNWERLGSQVFGINSPVERVTAPVYPNPAQQGFTADLSRFRQEKPVELKLYNSDGRLVYTTKSASGTDRIEIGTGILPPGLYLLKATQDNMEAVSRVVIR